MTATVISPNWPTDHTDFAFFHYGNPLAAPRLIHHQDLDGGKDDYTTDLQPATNGYFISALTGGQPARKQFRLVKTDTTGLILWQKTYGLSVNDFIANMRFTADGNIMLAGQSSPLPIGEFQLRMLLVNQQGDSLANLLYSYPRPLSPYASLRANGAFQDRLLPLRNGNFAMLAEIDTSSNGGSSITDTYSLVLKVNRRLQPRWQYTHRAKPLFGFPRRMFFAGACELQDSSLLVLATNQNGNTGHNNPFYLLRLDGQTGQLVASYQLLSNLCAQFHATKLLPDGDSALFVVGTCADASRRGTYAAHISLKNLPKVVVLAAAVPLPPTQPQFDTIYPNPADDAATLSYRCPAGLAGAGTLRVRDVLGREVQRVAVPPSSSSLRLALGSLASGLYVCELSWPGQVPATRKLLVSH